MRLIRFKPVGSAADLVIAAERVEAVEAVENGECRIYCSRDWWHVKHTFDEVLRMLYSPEVPTFAWPVKGSPEKSTPSVPPSELGGAWDRHMKTGWPQNADEKRAPVEMVHSAKRIGALKELQLLKLWMGKHAVTGPGLSIYVNERIAEIKDGDGMVIEPPSEKPPPTPGQSPDPIGALMLRNTKSARLEEMNILMNHVDNTPYSNNFIAAITDYVWRRKSEIETGGE